MTNCHETGPLLASYAFGALDPDEQVQVEHHLAQCPECRDALAALADLPALLDLAGNAETTIQTPPPLLEASVIAGLPLHHRSFPRIRRGHGLRGRRTRTLGAAALAGLVTAGIVLSQLGTGSIDHRVQLSLTASSHAPGARAIVRLLAHPWGTEVELSARGLAPTKGPQIYEVWFVSRRGRVSAGTFTVGPRGSVTVRLAAAAHASQYTNLGITLEPDGLDPARRGPNILRASLPA